MPTFTVLCRIDASTDYVAEVEANSAEEAAMLARENHGDYNWEHEQTLEFDARYYVTLDEEQAHIESTWVGLRSETSLIQTIGRAARIERPRPRRRGRASKPISNFQSTLRDLQTRMREATEKQPGIRGASGSGRKLSRMLRRGSGRAVAGVISAGDDHVGCPCLLVGLSTFLITTTSIELAPSSTGRRVANGK